MSRIFAKRWDMSSVVGDLLKFALGMKQCLHTVLPIRPGTRRNSRVFCCESPGILWKLSSKLMKSDLKLKDLKALFYNMKHSFPTSPIDNYFTNLSLNWYSSPLTLSLSKSSAPSAGDARSLSSECLPGISAMNLGSVKVL